MELPALPCLPPITFLPAGPADSQGPSRGGDRRLPEKQHDIRKHSNHRP